MKTPEELRDYQAEYYKQHRARYNLLSNEWRKANPKQAKFISDRWLATRPHYQRDYQRKRKAIVEPLIFEFLDNGLDGDVDGFIVYLRDKGVPEQHVKWFLKDVQKHLQRA